MPDACDRVVDLQLDIGVAFMDRRARAAALVAVRAYGLGSDCIACGLPIREDRLQAMPSAERCTHCQDKHDRKETARWRR